MSQVVTRTAPVGGWNARDALDNMDPSDAIVLENWFPQETRVSIREGYQKLVDTGTGAQVSTLASYEAGTVAKLLAASDGKFFDVADASSTQIGSGFTSDRWQWANFNGNMGLVNGADDPQTFNGSTLSAMTISGSGLTPDQLIGINVFKSRTYFWEVNSQDFWYSAVNALGGSLTKFPLSRVGQFGGNLVTMGTWTRDGGDGMDDLAVFFMSSGEVIIYQGSDPGVDFSLIGVFRIGSPIGVRSVAKFGADLVVITRDGYVSLSQAMQSRGKTLSDKIDRAVTEQIEATGEDQGWQPILYPRSNQMLFSYPTTSAGFEQHVVNVRTGAWAKFDYPAASFVLHQDDLYFGNKTGVVYQVKKFSDDGADIIALGQTAYDYLVSRDVRKRVTGVKISNQLDSGSERSVTLATDFDDSVTAQPVEEISLTGAEWDVAAWDEEDWVGAPIPVSDWVVRSNIGANFSIIYKVTSQSQVARWFSTSYLFEVAGLL